MKKGDFLELTTFVRSDIFEKIANGEQNEVLRVLYPSNREVFIDMEDDKSVSIIPYNAMRIIDIVNNKELHCEITNVSLIPLADKDDEVHPFIIRGKEYQPEGLVYELGNVIDIDDDTDK